MKANAANLLNLLNKPQQFVIPIYQRSYNWKEKHCEQLLKDILRISQDENSSGHFIGSIVYFQEGIGTVTSIPRLLVIDGQQRLTTIALIFIVLIKVIRENELEVEMTDKKIRNYYLLNIEEEDLLRYKLLLNRKDCETLINIIEGRDLDASASRDLVRNFKFFLSAISKENANLVLAGLQRLFIVDVALEYGKDNPQLIFESLNSTGLDLSQADLIRNYVLMDLKPDIQKNLYESYWYPMERLFGDKYFEYFDGFLRDYLTLKTGIIPRIDNIYTVFKNFVRVNGNPVNVGEVVADLYKFAKHYVRFALLKEPDMDLKPILENLETLTVNVSYPFLLFLYEEHSDNNLSKDELIETLSLIESYIFRRNICGIPTNSLNKTFAGFRKHISRDKVFESILAHFLLLDSYRRFPTNQEFQDALMLKDLYNTRSIKYALEKLENFNRKELVNVDEYTIEHIMPQNPILSEDWRQMLGENWKEIQNKYLHTVGNLTLTGYNPELSDRPFQSKQKIEGGFADSPLRLNEGLGTLPKWDEEEIIKRASSLANKSLQIWESPNLDREVLEGYRPSIPPAIKKIPHNLVELIDNEPGLVPAPSNLTYVRFKPKLLLDLKERLVANGYIPEDIDVVKTGLFWYEFRINPDSIRFAFLLGDYHEAKVREKILETYTRFKDRYPYLNRKLRDHWHTVYSKNLIAIQEYEELSDDLDNLDLFDLIRERFRDVIDNELPRLNDLILALAE